MPTAADMQAATPKCPGNYTNMGLHPCGKPMVYDNKTRRWVCPDHGQR